MPTKNTLLLVLLFGLLISGCSKLDSTDPGEIDDIAWQDVSSSGLSSSAQSVSSDSQSSSAGVSSSAQSVSSDSQISSAGVSSSEQSVSSDSQSSSADVSSSAISSSATSSSSNTPPEARNVTITGEPKEGQVLTASYDYYDADGDSEGNSEYRWYRDDQIISGENSLTYDIQYADSGRTIAFGVVVYTETVEGNLQTGDPVKSAPTEEVTGFRAPIVSNLQITGDPYVGDALTADYVFSDPDGDLEGSTLFQWYRDGAEISGATNSSYTLSAQDLGTTTSVNVTPVSATGAREQGETDSATTGIIYYRNELDSIIDVRDGQKYGIVYIGTQVWMAENVNYETVFNSWCYDNDDTNCELYGRLYSWDKAMQGAEQSSAVPSGVRGVCPTGWHIPSHAEWIILEEYIADQMNVDQSSTGGYEIAQYLRSEDWPGNTNPDAFHFAALPAGYRYSNVYSYLDDRTYFWTATDGQSTDYVYIRKISGAVKFSWDNGEKSNFALPVRCVKD